MENLNFFVGLFISYHFIMLLDLKKNKDENVHRFALSAIRGKLLEREKKRERVREKERER